LTHLRETLVSYRLEMARRTLNDARLLVESGGSPWSVANRAYYAMFYAVLALLIAVGQSPRKHAGAITLFDKLFVKPGLFPAETSRWLHRAFTLRQLADYRELADISPERASELVTWAGELVGHVERFLRAQQPRQN